MDPNKKIVGWQLHMQYIPFLCRDIPLFKLPQLSWDALFLQKLQVVAVPRESYGKFYDGDAYIIYCATPYGQPGGHSMKVGHTVRTKNIMIMFNKSEARKQNWVQL